MTADNKADGTSRAFSDVWRAQNDAQSPGDGGAAIFKEGVITDQSDPVAQAPAVTDEVKEIAEGPQIKMPADTPGQQEATKSEPVDTSFSGPIKVEGEIPLKSDENVTENAPFTPARPDTSIPGPPLGVLAVKTKNVMGTQPDSNSVQVGQGGEVGLVDPVPARLNPAPRMEPAPDQTHGKTPGPILKSAIGTYPQIVVDGKEADIPAAASQNVDLRLNTARTQVADASSISRSVGAKVIVDDMPKMSVQDGTNRSEIRTAAREGTTDRQIAEPLRNVSSIPQQLVATTLYPAAPSVFADPSMETAMLEDAEFGLHLTSLSGPNSRSAAPHPMQPYAPQVAHQIATATIQTRAGTTEIALNPQELGRVRMTLTTAESGVSVSIIAERPETADLMRRNIELLAKEFRDLGFESASFSFDDQSGESGGKSEGEPRNATRREIETTDSLTPPPIVSVALRGGLDLKL